MFLKDRSRGQRNGRTPRQDTRTDEECLTFSGVAWQGHDWVMIFEDVRAGKTMRIVPGEPFCHGTMTGVNIDSAQYCVGDKLARIPVGCTLAGTAPATQPAATQEAEASQAEAKPNDESPATHAETKKSGEDDVLERMRQRRAQELNQ